MMWEKSMRLIDADALKECADITNWGAPMDVLLK